MRISESLLNCVVFAGHGDSASFNAKATAFLITYGNFLYLVTARHVAMEFGEDPFTLRFNSKNGGALYHYIDLGESEEQKIFKWYHHHNHHADISILLCGYTDETPDIYCEPIDVKSFVRETCIVASAGCGSMCHVIGLFTFRSGKYRNIPVVHTGYLCAVSDSLELIESNNGGKLSEVEGHLVEISNLGGLSGSPVFVRTDDDQLKFLGVWQGSWDRSTHNQRVPIGMGIVTPAYRLVELLMSYEVSNERAMRGSPLGLG
jgi:hypothetical protein